MAGNKIQTTVPGPRELAVLFVSAVLGLAVWGFLSYNRISAVSLKVDRASAREIAAQYLRTRSGVDPSRYLTATVFGVDASSDRYLQRALGDRGAKAFRARHDHDLFEWTTRFFLPGQPEEFLVTVSPRTGRVVRYWHILPEMAARPDMAWDDAQAAAKAFLTSEFGFQLDEYERTADFHTIRDKRTDHSYAWRDPGVHIPWAGEPSGSGAKLSTGATLSGGEIISFYRHRISIPEDFDRFLNREQESGRVLSLAYNIAYIAIIVLAMSLLIRSRQHLATQTVRPFFYGAAACLAVAGVAGAFNGHESVLFGYPTSQDFTAYLWQNYIREFLSVFLFLAGLVMAALAAESVHARMTSGAGSGDGARGALLWYVRSSFLTRGAARTVLAGYFLAGILLGLQAIIFFVGEEYCGVWAEEHWVTQFSTAYWPFWAALLVGIQACLWEEMLFRVFLFNWLRLNGRGILMAALISSVVWGFGHSTYPVFPAWFRGLEMTFLGLVFVWAYLKYGVLIVLVAHFVFNIFWGTAGLLLSSPAPLYFWSAAAVLALPAFWAAAAWALNRPDEVRPLEWALSPAQSFHLKVLQGYIAACAKDGGDLAQLRRDCLAHGWDPAVVDKAFE